MTEVVRLLREGDVEVCHDPHRDDGTEAGPDQHRLRKVSFLC